MVGGGWGLALKTRPRGGALGSLINATSILDSMAKKALVQFMGHSRPEVGHFVPSTGELASSIG